MFWGLQIYHLSDADDRNNFINTFSDIKKELSGYNVKYIITSNLSFKYKLYFIVNRCIKTF